MRQNVIRLALAVVALLLVVAAPSRALADVTVTGTVSEIGLLGPQQSGNYTFTIIRFKFTDANLTKTCAQVNGPNVGATYAWFWGASQMITNGNQMSLPDPAYREWYAALLVSKKGAQISCTINDSNGCHVTSCTLP